MFAAKQRHAPAIGPQAAVRPDEESVPHRDRRATALADEFATEDVDEAAPFDSIVRTVVVKEVNGQHEETETIERCRDGTCTKDVKRVRPDGKESSSVQAYKMHP